MTSVGASSIRYVIGLLMSVGFNVGLVVSLAELDRPAVDEDEHDQHRVRPSVVPPPPPPPTAAAAASTPAATPLPAAPPAPNLDLPDPGLPSDGLTLALNPLKDIGLGAFEGLGTDRGLAPRSDDREPDVPPQLTVMPDLTQFFPQAALRRKLSGRSIVAVRVGTDGRVVAADVLRSEPPGIFERAAARAARSFRFIPARKKGRAVAARTRLELKWQLRN